MRGGVSYKASIPHSLRNHMDLQLKGKRALVTGGSRGIGKAIARVLAQEGVDVALLARSPETLHAAAAELATQTGRKVVGVAERVCVQDLARASGLFNPALLPPDLRPAPADGAPAAATPPPSEAPAAAPPPHP
jgi:NAD(P)-dependent dehydrogenase (short-subunit alcohol dehydrogenase family)